MSSHIEHYMLTVNGIRLHVVQSGPKEGPLVLLLHGFPEFWYGWRYQISYFARAGFRVWAPDQRGYNHSDKPIDIGSYSIDELARDVAGLIDASGRDKAYVVGHDWGAAVCWWIAMQCPEKIERMVVINVPHPAVIEKVVRRNFVQMLKSSYILFFQIPRIPEMTARLGNWAIVSKAMRWTSRSGAFTEEDMEHYREAWSRPNAYPSMLNWYRAYVRKKHSSPEDQRVRTPTLIVWGARDMFLGRELARLSLDFCDEGALVFIENATHWVHLEEPDRVNRLIDGFLRAGRGII